MSTSNSRILTNILPPKASRGEPLQVDQSLALILGTVCKNEKPSYTSTDKPILDLNTTFFLKEYNIIACFKSEHIRTGIQDQN